MRFCLYSPYFPKHFGGGEKYLLDVALTLAHYGTVELAVPGKTLTAPQAEKIYASYERFMGQNLRHLNLIASPLGTAASFLQKALWTKQFDLLYYLTDGSFFVSLARRSAMHIQIPLLRTPLSPFERAKKLTWQFINTNSQFTRQVVERAWHLPVSSVHQPMIDVVRHELMAAQTKKENVILHVGRFFRQLHSKRQDVLVQFFGHLLKRYPAETKGWKLVLVGSVEDETYAREVRAAARNLPIKIIHDVTRDELNRWYARAKIYWHATGYGVSESKYPAKMEHFGISTLEAMASGAVPVVINKGGQPEVLGEQLTELLWDSEQACLAKTVELMNNESERQALANTAQLRAQRFGPEAFENNLVAMLKTLHLLK
jgi:glycosyltransferase involved in cell wall biosynthesis